ncbi:MAG TPA: hypothetical protein PLU11_14280 [Chitinophagaceae bacterium]|nr:hypothetical protein [Chitinophagaceae bacterium]HPN60350.1 hypothetical protein [Chitinophagaceae bacterium]
MLRKTQILTWLVVLLLVLNAVTIGTIIYHQRQEKKAISDISIGGYAGTNPLNGRFFRQEMGFNTQQMDVFRELNQAFRPASMEITFLIDSLKEVMYNQLTQAKSDSLQLQQLSEEIGALHSQLKKETVLFYIRLKEICTPDQQKQLAEVFKPLFITEHLTDHGNYRNGPGWKRKQTD